MQRNAVAVTLPCMSRDGSGDLGAGGGCCWTILSHITLNHEYNVGFEVLAAMTMKSTVFLDVAPCSLVEVHRHF
jgi:hypothetical protein